MDRNLNPAAAAEAPGARLKIEKLVKLFGPHRAVDGVSLEVEPGEFLALLGPSGSGKTSILMSIAGFQTPEYGDIWIGGRNVTELPANQRNIGVVFQSYALFPHMTVAGNVAFPLRMRRRSAAERSRLVAEALAMVRLAGHADKLPAQLSGGQQQRVAIARALVFQPKLLLMDEPLGALDRRLRQDMQFELKQLQRELGVTILYVTHDQDEALTMASRIAVLRDGRLEQIGTPRDLYERPANAFVADFIGETNLVPVTLELAPGGGAMVLADQRVVLPPDMALPPGPAGRFAIRPERLLIQPAAPAMPGLQGVVAEIVYSGGTTVLHVELNPGTAMRSRIATGPSACTFSRGDRVALSWASGDARIYPA